MVSRMNEGDQQLFRIALGTDPPVQLHSFPKSSLLNLKVFPGNAHFICKGGRGGIAPKTMPEYLGQGENQPFGFSGLFQASYPAYGIQGVKKKVGIDLAAKTLQFSFLCQFLTFPKTLASVWWSRASVRLCSIRVLIS